LFSPVYNISRFLNVRGVSSPSFSPDGATLAFVSAISGVPQVWSMPAIGGWPEQLTFLSERISVAVFSPVQDGLVYGIDSGGNERTQLHLLKANGADDKELTTAPASLHTFGGWSPDGSCIAYSDNERSAAFFDVLVRDIASGTVQRIELPDGTYNVAGWAPDSRRIVISRAETNFFNDLLLAEIETGEVRPLTRPDRRARYRSVAWQPDGSGFYVVSDLGHDMAALCRYDLAAGELTTVAAPDAEVEEVRLTWDGRLLAFTVNEDGYSRLLVRDLGSGQERVMDQLPRGVITEPVWAPDNRRLAFVHTSGARNPDIYIWDTGDAGTDAVKQVTRSSRAGLPASAFVEPEIVHFSAHDGLSIPGLWYAPAATSQPLPTVLFVHGGPESQSRPAYNGVIAYLVHRGFGVLAPNVRGSTGYGNRYRSLDDLELRMDSVADLRSAVEFLVSSGRARRDGIAVMGGSYGGFMVLAALTTYPDLWAAGVDIVGIANWVTFMENTGPWRRKNREAEYGSLELHRDLLEAISPLHKADRIVAPLLVIHGANDPRVPIGEAEQIVAAVRGHEVPCEYLRFEDEGHGLVKLPNRITGYTAIADFLDVHLTGAHGESA